MGESQEQRARDTAEGTCWVSGESLHHSDNSKGLARLVLCALSSVVGPPHHGCSPSPILLGPSKSGLGENRGHPPQQGLHRGQGPETTVIDIGPPETSPS